MTEGDGMIHRGSRSGDQHRVRLAVIGAGMIGQVHARIAAKLPECELVALSDTDA